MPAGPRSNSAFAFLRLGGGEEVTCERLPDIGVAAGAIRALIRMKPLSGESSKTSEKG